MFQARGLFSLLDDESKFPQGTDQSFEDKLIKNFAKRPEFKTPKGQCLEFMIEHFAGQVCTVTLLLTVDFVFIVVQHSDALAAVCYSKVFVLDVWSQLQF